MKQLLHLLSTPAYWGFPQLELPATYSDMPARNPACSPAFEAALPVMVPPAEWHVVQHSIWRAGVVEPQQQPEQAAVVNICEAVPVSHNLHRGQATGTDTEAANETMMHRAHTQAVQTSGGSGLLLEVAQVHVLASDLAPAAVLRKRS